MSHISAKIIIKHLWHHAQAGNVLVELIGRNIVVVPWIYCKFVCRIIIKMVCKIKIIWAGYLIS